jgi:hypothetical protein
MSYRFELSMLGPKASLELNNFTPTSDLEMSKPFWGNLLSVVWCGKC